MVLTVVRLLTQWGKLIQTTCCMYTVREKMKHSPTRPSACSCCLGFTLKAVGQVENKKQLVSHRNLKKPEVDPSDCSSPPLTVGFPTRSRSLIMLSTKAVLRHKSWILC